MLISVFNSVNFSQNFITFRLFRFLSNLLYTDTIFYHDYLNQYGFLK